MLIPDSAKKENNIERHFNYDRFRRGCFLFSALESTSFLKPGQISSKLTIFTSFDSSFMHSTFLTAEHNAHSYSKLAWVVWRNLCVNRIPQAVVWSLSLSPPSKKRATGNLYLLLMLERKVFGSELSNAFFESPK